MTKIILHETITITKSESGESESWELRISPQLSNWLGRNDDCHYTRCGVTFCSSGQKDNFLSQYRHWWGVFTIPKALSIPSIMFLLVTDESLISNLHLHGKRRKQEKNIFLPCWENSVTEVMFLLGIGGHLKVSHMDPRVSFGNESTNLSVRKSFFKIIAPYHI